MAPPPYWRVECIGMALIANYITEQLVVVPGEDERARLLAFASRANKARPGPQLVTFRGRGFDAPVLDARCMKYGIPLTYMHSPRMDHRYSMGGHFDLADHLNVFGAARSLLDVIEKTSGLDELAAAIYRPRFLLEESGCQQ